MNQKIGTGMSLKKNSVDPDQTAPREQSDLGLLCLHTVLQILPQE